MGNKLIATGLYTISSVILLFLATVIIQAQSSDPVRVATIPMELPNVAGGQSGNLETSISLPVVSGSGGLTPSLGITFAGGNRGLLSNWDLMGLTFIALERGSVDRYISAPGGRLVETSAGDYRTKLDQGVVYTASSGCGDGPCSWSVRGPDGTISTFGSTPASRISTPDGRVLFWALDRVEDLNGNFYSVNYDSTEGRLFPRSIIYGQNNSLSLVERKIDFNYTDNYSGPGSTTPSYVGGLRNDVDRYLDSITSSYNDTVIYRYNFGYESDSQNSRARLKTFTEKIEGKQLRTALTFNYKHAPLEYDTNTIETNTGVGTPSANMCKRGANICLLDAYGNIANPVIKGIVAAACIHFQQFGQKECETGNTWGVAELNGDGTSDFVAAINKYSGSGRRGILFNAGELLGEFSDGDERGGVKGAGFYMDFNGDGRDDFMRMDHWTSGIQDRYGLRVSYGGFGNTGDFDFSESHAIDGLTNQVGMGFDTHASFKQLLMQWLSYEYNRKQEQKMQRIEKLTGGLGVAGGLLGGLGGALAGGAIGMGAGVALYGNMGASIGNALQLGQVVLGHQGSSKDQFSQFADMNGDGLPDYIRLMASNKLVVSFSNGYDISHSVESAVDSGLSIASSYSASTGLDLSDFPDLNEDGEVNEDDLDLNSDGEFNDKDLDANEDGTFDENDYELMPEGLGEKIEEVLASASSVVASKGFRALADMNGDGVPDFVVLVSDSGEFKFKIHYGQRDGQFQTGVLSSVIDPGGSDFRMLIDLNGDGYSDFLRIGGSKDDKLMVTYGSGSGPGITIESDVGESPVSGRTLGDVNGDGALDFIRFVKDDATGEYRAMARLMRGSGFDAGANLPDIYLGFTHPNSGSLYNRIVFFTYVNGDGRTDVMAPRSGAVDLITAPVSSPELLESISNEYQQATIDYRAALNDSDVLQPEKSHRTIEDGSLLANKAPRFLVAEVTISGQSGDKARTTYRYYNDMIKIGPTPSESMALGVEKIVTRSYVRHKGDWEATPSYSVQEFYHAADAIDSNTTLGFALIGMPKKSLTYRSDNDALLTEESYAYNRIDTATPANGSDEIYKIYSSSFRSSDYTANLALSTHQEVKSVDSYGNPTCTIDYGDEATAGDDRSTVIGYQYPTEVPYGRPDTTAVYTGSDCESGNHVSYQQLSYDSNGNVSTRSSGLSPEHTITTTMTYDQVGNVLISENLGLTTTMEYDDDTASYAVSITDPAGNEKSMTYNYARGLLLTTTNQNDTTTINNYDELGRKVSTLVEADGSGTHTINTINYDHYSDGSTIITSRELLTGNISSGVVRESEKHSNEWGVVQKSIVRGEGGDIVTTYIYDEFDRETSRSLPHFRGNEAAGEYTTQYDYLGRVISTSRPGPNGNPLTITQNPGKLYSVKFTSSVGTNSGVELKGYSLLETKPNGQKIYQYKTRDGKLIQSEYQTGFVEAAPAPTNGSGNTTGTAPSKKSGWTRIRYHYDELGRVAKVTRGTSTVRNSYYEDANVQIITHYDDYGRVIKTEEPDRGVTTITYNNLHKPECSNFGNGKTLCRKYDAFGRLIALHKEGLPDEHSPGGEALASYAYGADSDNDGQGRLVSINDESGTINLQYDAISGKPSLISRSYNIMGEERVFDVHISYSAAGIITGKSYSTSKLSLGYEYFPEGKLKRVLLGDENQQVLSAGEVIALYRASAPNALGNSATIYYPNGVELESQFVNGTTYRSSFVATDRNETALADIDYIYNNEGLLTAKNDNLLASYDATETFSYDIVRRLTAASGPYGDRTTPLATHNYFYGKDGQLYNRNGSWAFYKTGEPHKLEKLNTISYGYDSGAGNGRGSVAQRTIGAVRGKPNVPPNPPGLPPEGIQAGPNQIIQQIEYSYLNRIKTINANGPLGRMDAEYIYDVNGERFQKIVSGDRLNNRAGTTVTTYLTPEYKIESSGGSETHTFELRIGNQLLGRFSFIPDDNTYFAGGTSGHHTERLLAYGGNILSLKGGAGNLLGLISSSYALFRLQPEVYYTYLFWITFIILLIIVLFVLIKMWRTVTEDDYIINGTLLRPISLMLLIVFYGNFITGCANLSDPNRLFTVAASGVLDVGGGSTTEYERICNGEKNPPHNYQTGDLGAYYFISLSPNGSNDLVTDGCGRVVQRYYYLPYGKVNRELSDYDPDGDNVQYRGDFRFTGHEFDGETGLVYMRARMYDPETTRFMGADPVHTERAGFDSYDRYQYVNANPVNFVDPDGKSWLSDRLGTSRHYRRSNFSQAVRNFNKATSSTRGISKVVENSIHDANKLFVGSDYNCPAFRKCTLKNRLSTKRHIRVLAKKKFIEPSNEHSREQIRNEIVAAYIEGRPVDEGLIERNVLSIVKNDQGLKYYSEKISSELDSIFFNSIFLGGLGAIYLIYETGKMYNRYMGKDGELRRLQCMDDAHSDIQRAGCMR